MTPLAGRRGWPVEAIETFVYTVPTETPESDGTLEWESTTIVVAEVSSGGATGLGYTYGSPAVERVITEHLAPLVQGADAMQIRALWDRMTRALRNVGLPGIGSMAVAALDTAMWDLKAKLLGVPLVTLLGQVRESVPGYGSGGFTSYSVAELQAQLSGWANEGCTAVKMKVGREPEADGDRVAAARQAIGPGVELFVDANGAYDRKQALAYSESFHRSADVSWFEEPVSSNDLEGLRLLRDRAPAGMRITSGEYGSVPADFKRLLAAGAVDVLMPDVTRCGGITGLLDLAAVARAFEIPLSTHTAPALHLHPACAIAEVLHLEYFHDHVRVEQMLFDGVAPLEQGCLRPALDRPGNGLKLMHSAARRFAA